MFWKWFWKALVFLFILAILVVGGVVIYRAGYLHGLSAELRSIEPGGETTQPLTSPHYYAPYRLPYPRPMLFFPLCGMLLFFPFLLIILGGLCRSWRYRSWKTAGGPEEMKRYWYKHHRSHPWHHPCWEPKAPDKDRPDDQPEMEDQPESGDPSENPE